MGYGWSICLAAELPKIIEPETEKIDKRINLFDRKTLEEVLNCGKRRVMDGVFFKSGCDGCGARCRLNLEEVGN